MRLIRKNIDMIATFRTGQPPEPFKFRIRDRYGNVHIIRIERILGTEQGKVFGNDVWNYRCQGRIGSQERIFVVQFNVQKAEWMLLKL